MTATNVSWHPSGRFIAVNINTQDRVAFFEVTDGGKPNSDVGKCGGRGHGSVVGRFSRDGRFYLTSDWGRDFTATDVEGRIPQAPSSISVVRLADLAVSGEKARHERIGGATTDTAAEGIAVSPDGRLVATVNMRTTAFPPESRRFQREATVTLLMFDPQSGSMTKVADYPLDGVLPEGGTFDLTGDHFLATVFHGHGEGSGGTGAGLEVFRVVKGSRPALERVGRIPVSHGVHHVDVAQ